MPAKSVKGGGGGGGNGKNKPTPTPIDPAPTDPAPTDPTPPAGDELNILLRGQSNAILFFDYGGIYRLEAALEQQLGINVNVLASWQYSNNTMFSATKFMDWDTGGQRDSLLRYINSQPESIQDNPTITLWMHNEYDQGTVGLQTSAWVNEVSADAAMVRSALGQTAETTPYLFAPIRYPYGPSFGAIEDGMEQMAASGFNADISYDAYASDVRMNGGPEAGDNASHMSREDAALIGQKLVDDMVATYRDIVL